MQLQIQTITTKSGDKVQAVLFDKEKKIAKHTIAYQYCDKDFNPAKNAASALFEKHNLNKRLGKQVSTKGAITTYEVH